MAGALGPVVADGNISGTSGCSEDNGQYDSRQNHYSGDNGGWSSPGHTPTCSVSALVRLTPVLRDRMPQFGLSGLDCVP